MATYLLDTNIISEVIKESPETKVLDFLTAIEDAYLSVDLKVVCLLNGLSPCYGVAC